MQNNLLFSLILNISLLVLMATVLTELRPLRLMIKRQERSVYNQLFLGLIFGLLSISCTYTGLSFEGAVVNTRVVSTLAAGLVGGPMSGVCAGLMSGIHRYFYNPAGFTSFACGIGTFGFGVFGAVSYRLFARRGRRTLDLILLTVAAELMQAALILLLSKPFFAALALEKAILLPKMIVNSVGLVAFMRILDRLNRDLTIELVEQRAVALLIAQECLPYLRKGIRNREDLQRAVDIVREKLPHFQVALTDRTQVLAASGCDLSVTSHCRARGNGPAGNGRNGGLEGAPQRHAVRPPRHGRTGHRRAASHCADGAEPCAGRGRQNAREPCAVFLRHAGAR